jgi:hypothetical protein
MHAQHFLLEMKNSQGGRLVGGTRQNDGGGCFGGHWMHHVNNNC